MEYKLSDICKGITDGSHNPPVGGEKSEFFMLSSKNVFDDYITFEDPRYLSEEQFVVEHKRTNITSGDVLMTIVGTVGRTAVVPMNIPAITLQRSVAVLHPKEDICNSRYLMYLLRSKRPYFEREAHGVAQKGIYLRQLSDVRVDVLEIETQKKIVQILDKVSAVIENRQLELQKFDNLIKARFVELFGEPEANNKSWPIEKLHVLCKIGSSKRIYQEEQSTDGVPFWRISDLVAQMDTGKVEASLFIPEDRYKELMQQGLVPKPGDILVTSRGTLGRCYIITNEDCFYFQDGMISWLSEYKEGITPLYLQYLFEMPGFRKQIDSMQAGSTVAYLSIAMLKKLNVMVPDKEVQNQFAAFVAQVDKSKLVVQQALDKVQLLFNNLMQQYFG